VSGLIVITGEIQAGKTTLCRELADSARDQGWDVAGLLSPAVFEGGEKTAIDVINLRDGERRRLAELNSGAGAKLETKRWSFFSEPVSWGNQILKEAVPCDLLIIDELGPLEFNRAEGWLAGFDAIKSRAYRYAAVVIRSSLIETASRRWNISRIIGLEDTQSRIITGKDLFKSLFPGNNPASPLS
jgi:nucleoside-triphosphatase THEP1